MLEKEHTLLFETYSKAQHISEEEYVFYMSIIKIESSVRLVLTRKTFKFHKDNPNLLFSHFMFIVLFFA